MNPSLQACLTASPDEATVSNLNQWRQCWQSICQRTTNPIERAIGSGFAADCLAWAFLGGYQAALRLVDPTLLDTQTASFCVTEAGGNRPSNIQTAWRDSPDQQIQLDGQKSWLALGSDCDVLLVAARKADVPDAQIAMIRVPIHTPGVSITNRTDINLVPEVPHARALFTDVNLPRDSVLPGDGYAGFVKPFRTMEDIHVTAGLLSFVLRQARCRQWPDDFIEQTVAAIGALVTLAPLPAAAPATHIELAGVLHNVAELIGRADGFWQSAGDENDALRWVRDKKLFTMAAKVRSLRAQRAWQALQS